MNVAGTHKRHRRSAPKAHPSHAPHGMPRAPPSAGSIENAFEGTSLMPLSDEKEIAVLRMQEGNARWMGNLDPDGRTQLTEPARRSYLQQLMREIDPDGTLPPAEVEFKARQRRREILARISRLGVEERLRRKAERDKAAAGAALDDLAVAMGTLAHLEGREQLTA